MLAAHEEADTWQSPRQDELTQREVPFVLSPGSQSLHLWGYF
jgi:hypothetical protein